MPRILFRLAVLGSLVSGGSACTSGRPVGSSPLNPAPAAGGTIPFASALILGTTGATPPDTSVTFPAGEQRVIVLRYAPPDNSVFATLVFGPTAFASDSGGMINIRLHARPNVYGLDLATSSPIGRGATVTFDYPRFFVVPPDARHLYGSDAAYERTLAVMRLAADSTLVVIPSTRPGPDQLQAPLPSAGTYYVAAPR